MNANSNREANTIRRLQTAAQQQLASLKADYYNNIDKPMSQNERRKIESDIRLAESKIRTNNVNNISTGVSIIERAINIISKFL